MKPGHIHFSIDDVILSLKWLRDKNPDSIFDLDFFKSLRHWNEIYGLQFSLYVFETCDGFSIDNLPKKYWDEFRRNDSWLKFCWHRRKGGFLTDDIDTEINSFERVKRIICDNISERAWTDTVRLHRFGAEKDFISFLRKKGNISCLLCADDDRLCYDLTDRETDLLKAKRIIIKNGLIYRRTDFRLDSLDTCSDEDLRSLAEKSKKLVNDIDKRLTVFCHEWKFNSIYKNLNLYLRYTMSL